MCNCQGKCSQKGPKGDKGEPGIQGIPGMSQVIASGSATLVGGTITVSCPQVLSTSLVIYSRKTIGGTVGNMSYTISNGVSFTINSSNGSDTSTITYIVV